MKEKPEELETEVPEGKNIKEILDSLGVSCHDVAMAVVGGKKVALDYIPQNGDRIDLIPVIAGG